MEKYVLLAFVVFMAFVFWSVFSGKGRSRQFGGIFAWSSEPYVIDKSSSGKQTLIVHSVQPHSATDPSKVGLELRFTSALAFSMTPLSLSAEQARRLANDLKKAADLGSHGAA